MLIGRRIITLACRLQVGALLYRRVIVLALQSSIPTHLLDKIHTIYRQTAVQNLRN